MVRSVSCWILAGPTSVLGARQPPPRSGVYTGLWTRSSTAERTTDAVPRFDRWARAWWSGCSGPAPRGAVLDQTQELDRFLAETTPPGHFGMAAGGIRDPDVCVDVVQDAMCSWRAATPPGRARMAASVLSDPGKRDRDLQRRRTVRKKSCSALPGTHGTRTTRGPGSARTSADGGRRRPELIDDRVRHGASSKWSRRAAGAAARGFT